MKNVNVKDSPTFLCVWVQTSQLVITNGDIGQIMFIDTPLIVVIMILEASVNILQDISQRKRKLELSLTTWSE